MTSFQDLNGFFLYSLLLAHAESEMILVLPKDTGDIREALHNALERRNTFTEGNGQELWAHACDDYCIVNKEDDTKSLLFTK